MQNDPKSSPKPDLTTQKLVDKKLIIEVNLPPDHEVEVICHHLDPVGQLRSSEVLRPSRRHEQKQKGNIYAFKGMQITKLGFLLAMLVYLLVRFIGIEDFPISFLGDEAIQSVHAADLLRDNFFNHRDEFLPIFFENGGQYNLSLSVYLQVLPTWLFGKSVFVTRGVSVLVSLLAALGDRGVTLRHNARVTGLHRSDLGWRLQLASGEEIIAARKNYEKTRALDDALFGEDYEV